MTMQARRGSILLFCIALVGALTVLAYGFVRIAQLGASTGDTSNLHLLARQAAQTGLHHAVEQLVRDYQREPLTRMDSPGVAMWVSHDNPYMTGFMYDDASIAGGSQKLNTDNIPGENTLDNVISNSSSNYVFGGPSAFYPLSRFYEPEFYNLPSAPAGFSTTAQVSTPVRFNSAWPGPPYPDRSEALFYDQQLRPVGGARETARANARYRLRYAVLAQDLEGMFLVNGDQAVGYREITSTDPNASGLSAAAARVVRNMHKVPPVLLAEDGWAQNNSSNVPYIWIDGPFRGEHVFIGRGSTANVDRNPAKGNAPCTFPLMYRWQDNAQSFLEYSNSSSSPDGWPAAENLYSTTAAPLVAGLAGGGEIMGGVSANWGGSVFEHILTGPQFTFANFQAATYGHGNRELNSMNTGNGNQVGHVTTLGRYTPFGRGVSKRLSGEAITRYRGNTDTPWCLNVLTIAPNVVRGMVQGYMPPGAMHALYHNRNKFPYRWASNKDYIVDNVVLNDGNKVYRCIVAGRSAGSGGPTGTGAAIVDNTVTWQHIAAQYDDPDSFRAAVVAQRDLFVAPLSPAFQRYAPPARAAPAISPDFHVRAMVTSDPGYRAPADRYPGKLAFNGYGPTVTHGDDRMDLVGKWTNDDLGYYLRSNRSTQNEFFQELGATLPSGRSRAKHIDRIEPYTALAGTNDPMPSHASGNLHCSIGHGDGSYPNPICLQNQGVRGWSQNTRYQLDDVVRTTVGSVTTNYICIGAGTSVNSGSPPSGAGTRTDGTVTWQSLDYVNKNVWVTAHHNSIWDVVANAMANAVSMVQGQWLQYTTKTGGGGPERQRARFFNDQPWVDNATVPGVSRTGSIKDLDALFVTNLGHSWLVPNDPVPVPVWRGGGGYPWKLSPSTPDWNIASLNPSNPKCLALAANPALMPVTATAPAVPNLPLASANDPGGTYPVSTAYAGYTANPSGFWNAGIDQFNATYRTQAMELIVNDFRLSFFGASPQYGSDFRAFDFNGDGKAACSGFEPNAAATPDETALHLDQYTTNVDGNGIAGEEVKHYFSNTGCFFLGKSRFWRIIVRGEVWDNYLKISNNTVDLDAVICLDPTDADNAWTGFARNPGRQYATHLLYQSWVYNNYRSLLPRRD